MADTYFNSTLISTATTTLVKTGKGVLGSLIVNGGTAGTIKIYDGIDATGTLIADFDSTNALNTYKFNRGVKVGICVVTGAATKATVTWK